MEKEEGKKNNESSLPPHFFLPSLIIFLSPPSFPLLYSPPGAGQERKNSNIRHESLTMFYVSKKGQDFNFYYGFRFKFPIN